MTKKKNVTRSDVADWAKDAITSAGGEAWWQNPITTEVRYSSHRMASYLTLPMPQNDKARGMFMSVYMLRTFAPHLSVISKSYM